ncbi:MAG TPA: response regulator transcription factor [Acidimicrobiales bacterium]|nr:response regulator transcription factor [Acidimicrobiales bacterium]
MLRALSSTDEELAFTGGPRLRVIVADDHPELRDLLRSALEATGVITVVGEAPDGATAVWMAEQLRPGAVVSDLWMPVMRGDAALRTLRDTMPGTVLVLCSAEPDPDAVRESQADVVVDRRKVGWVAYLSDSLLIRAHSAGPPDWPGWERRQRPR